MVGTHTAKSTRNSAEIPGDSLFSGRGKRIVDSVPGEDVDTVRKDTQGSGHWKTGRSRRSFCDQQTRTSPLCPAPEADCFGRGDSLLGSHAVPSPQASFGCLNG